MTQMEAAAAAAATTAVKLTEAMLPGVETVTLTITVALTLVLV